MPTYGATSLQTETATWVAGINALGGGFEWNSIAIANNLVRVLRTKSYYPKLVYLLPVLGRGILAARMPLIDTLVVGAATNTAFVDADYNQATGIQGNGTTKVLNTLVLPSQLGLTNNGGIGYWENNISFTGSSTEPMGSIETAATNRFNIELHANLRKFWWGLTANAPSDANAATNGHYYGQRNGATSRALYYNAGLVASNATNDATSGSNNTTFRIVGDATASQFFWAGRCSLAYMTNGTFTTDEISDMHTIMQAYLIGPTGRP